MGAPRAPRDAVFSGRGNATTPAMGTCLFQHICELGWSSPVPLTRKVPLGSPKGAPVTAPPDPALAETLQPLGSPPPGHRPSGAAGAAGAGGPAFWRPCLLPPGLTAAWPPEWPRHPLRRPSRPGSGHPSGTARALGKAGLSEDKGRSPPGGAGHPHHAGHLAPWTACQVCLDLPCELVLEGRAAGPMGH